MVVTIDSIEDAGPDRRARRLMFSDGSVRLTAGAVVRQLKLVEGMQLDWDVFVDRILQLEDDLARERGLRLVGYRERSSREVVRRLVDDGYPSVVAESLVSRFVELGLIDDERFGRMFVRSRFRAGFGAYRVSRELANTGVSAEIVESAMLECANHDPIEAARKVIGGRTPSNRQERERFIKRLMAKGYDFNTAAAAVLEPSSESQDETCW